MLLLLSTGGIFAEDNADVRVTWDEGTYLWNRDTEQLAFSAKVQNEDKSNLQIGVAQYDQNGRLLAITLREAETSVCADVAQNAVLSKFFLWNKALVPLANEKTLKKVTDGEFIYIDVSRNERGNGSYQQPYNSINRARAALDSLLKKSDEENFYMVFFPGNYYVGAFKTLEFESSSFNCPPNKHVIFTSLAAERAKITGSLNVDGFALHDADKNIYRAAVPEYVSARQLYVNNEKAIRARTEEDPYGFENLDKNVFSGKGLVSDNAIYKDLKYPMQTELWFINGWRHRMIMPDKISDSNGKSAFLFDGENKGNWQIMACDNTAVSVPVYLENAYEFLDTPGEWYLDTQEHYLYYIPRDGENLQAAEVVIPSSETLLRLTGTPDNPIQNLTFRELEFTCSTWNEPTKMRSFLCGQNAVYQAADNGSLMPGAVEVYCGKNISFECCAFRDLGACALKMTGSIRNCRITENEFYRISGSAMCMGDVTQNIKMNDLGALPDQSRNPSDEKYAVKNNRISDNYIHFVATDYYSAAGISLGYPIETEISNNTLTNGAYSGIHIGWGWNNEKTPSAIAGLSIKNNVITGFMNSRVYDGGAIYVLGKTSGSHLLPNNIQANYIANNQNTNPGIYPDEGSSMWNIFENVLDLSRFPLCYQRDNLPIAGNWLNIWTNTITDIAVFDNYSTTQRYLNRGTNISYEKPAVFQPDAPTPAVQSIIKHAGVTSRERFFFESQNYVPKQITLRVGETEQISVWQVDARNEKTKQSNDTVVFTSQDESIASVTGDTLSAHKAGNTWVYAHRHTKGAPCAGTSLIYITVTN